MASLDYAQSLPDPNTLRAMLEQQLELYRSRDDLILRFRDALEGRNPIKVPQSTQYKAVATHGYHLQSAFNEKAARYRRVPEYSWLPIGREKSKRIEADRFERALNGIMETMELQSDTPVWKSVTEDVITLDAGVERIERAPAAFWPEISVYDKEGRNALMRQRAETDELDEFGDRKLIHLFEDGDLYEKHKDEYLKQAGVPIRSVWVPLERFYPVFEGGTLVECFEVEERSLRSVLANPLFDTSALASYSLGQDGGLSQKVVILHYCNQRKHAYYALGPSDRLYRAWPTLTKTSSLPMGQPILLHEYEHGIGRPIYNYVGGRGGSWRGGSSRQEGVMKAILELNQDADEVRSQIATYIRNVLWPTRVMKYSREARGADESLPKAPAIPEGGTIAMWSDESLENVTQSLPDFRLAEWHYNTIKNQIGELAGAPSLFGLREPGVNTGYHQQLQISQAEHLDAQLEASLTRGAINRALLVLEHIKCMGEKVYSHYHSKDSKGRMTAEYLFIDPARLDPMPQLSAKVRDPKPADVLSAMQAVTQATTMRPGHNDPLMDDETALELFLGLEDTSEVERRKLEQKFRRELMATPNLMQEMVRRLGLELASRGGGVISQQDAMDASPAFQQAAQQMNVSGEAAAMGGVSPMNLDRQIQGQEAQLPEDGAAGLLTGVGGGVAPGQPQPAQTFGRGRALIQQAQQQAPF